MHLKSVHMQQAHSKNCSVVSEQLLENILKFVSLHITLLNSLNLTHGQKACGVLGLLLLL